RREAEFEELSKKFEELTKRFRELECQLAGAKKDSTNSSKPPSSDIVKPPSKKSGKEGRRRGGQLGHGPQQRPPFELREIDDVQLHTHESCPQCGGSVEQLSSVPVLQQVELVTKPTLVTEHHSGVYHCRACGEKF